MNEGINQVNEVLASTTKDGGTATKVAWYSRSGEVKIRNCLAPTEFELVHAGTRWR